MEFLEVKGLTKYFDVTGGLANRLLWGEKMLKAVDHVSFTVQRGRIFGLVGESGCGKSTTARLICRLIPAGGGEIHFDGRDVLALSGSAMRELRKEIQMVFQDPFASLNPRMKVEDIVGRPLSLYYGMNGASRRGRVAELLEMVGLQAMHLNRYPHEFSGGQRQRIAVARALATQPKLLVADEPVSALDVSVQAQLLNLFKQLQRDLGLTMIFISHDLNVVEYIADTVGVMYAGKMMEVAPADEIFRSPLHPYTKGLISSNPRPSPLEAASPTRLQGEIKLPINPSPGCRLEPRCPIRVERCKSVEPPLEAKRPAHTAACHEL